MSVRLILAIPCIFSFAVLAALALANRRTLFGDAADELSDVGADEGGRAFFQHPQPTTQRERNEHA